jgi:hypothetical protein
MWDASVGIELARRRIGLNGWSHLATLGRNTDVSGADRTDPLALSPMTTEKADSTAAHGLWEHIQGELDEAAEKLQLDEGMHRVLRVAKRELTVNFPVTHDDGHVEVYTGYRVHHNVNRGPASGGIRYVQGSTSTRFAPWPCSTPGRQPWSRFRSAVPRAAYG